MEQRRRIRQSKACTNVQRTYLLKNRNLDVNYRGR